ncbi:MAG: amino acid ABC transporter permease [Methanomassiliicoccus sp.]|nr:amino acid ABC transporter permease [Methanomassiliicoccus sp.]
MTFRDTLNQRKEIVNKIGVAIVIILLFAIMLQSQTNAKFANQYLNATIVTVEISLVSIAMGLGIGIVMGLGRISKNFIARGIATIYIEILRGTPLLIQIFILYYGVASFHILFNPFVAGALALGLNSGAYQAEIIRGGIQSIPTGQMEAARSSGLSYLQAMRYVILPQGFRLIIPPMTNEYVTVIKDSSLAYTIGVMEITYWSSRIIPQTFDTFTILLFAALIYFTLTFSTSTIMRLVERKFRIPGYMGA